MPQVRALQCRDRATRHHHAERRQCVSFRVGASSFAFEMAAIQEIIRVPELQPSVLNSALCLGRINFRGAPKMMRNPGAQGDQRRTLSVFQCDRLLQRLATEIPALAA